MDLSDDAIRRLVLNNPIPDKLIRNLQNAPLLAAHETPGRVYKAKRYGVTKFGDPLSDVLKEVLILVCHGYTNQEIAKRLYYSFFTVKEMIVAIIVAYGAKNRTHLASLAVAYGDVDIKKAA